MTQGEFLSGVSFRVPGDEYTRYKLVPNANDSGEPGYLVQSFGKQHIATEHHANVKKTNKARFMVYVTVCGKTVRAWRNFSDYEVII